jgi:hypothetical protein
MSESSYESAAELGRTLLSLLSTFFGMFICAYSASIIISVIDITYLFSLKSLLVLLAVFISIGTLRYFKVNLSTTAMVVLDSIPIGFYQGLGFIFLIVCMPLLMIFVALNGVRIAQSAFWYEESEIFIGIDGSFPIIQFGFEIIAIVLFYKLLPYLLFEVQRITNLSKRLPRA